MEDLRMALPATFVPPIPAPVPGPPQPPLVMTNG